MCCRGIFGGDEHLLNHPQHIFHYQSAQIYKSILLFHNHLNISIDTSILS